MKGTKEISHIKKYDIIIRQAVPSDAEGLATVQAYTWWATYQGIMPKDYLENRIVSIDKATLQFTNCINTMQNCIVAETNREIVGILFFKQSKNPNYPKAGEIKGIYVLERYQKMGIGRRLFVEGVKALLNLRYKEMIITVLQANKRGTDFYLNLGGKVVGEFDSTFGDVTLKQNIIYYDDIQSLYEKLTKK